jgi:hypothetical protein
MRNLVKATKASMVVTYVAVAYNITFPGKMRACNTAQGFGGKPCNWVHP